jgi:hypothetical protein
MLFVNKGMVEDIFVHLQKQPGELVLKLLLDLIVEMVIVI